MSFKASACPPALWKGPRCMLPCLSSWWVLVICTWTPSFACTVHFCLFNWRSIPSTSSLDGRFSGPVLVIRMIHHWYKMPSALKRDCCLLQDLSHVWRFAVLKEGWGAEHRNLLSYVYINIVIHQSLCPRSKRLTVRQGSWLAGLFGNHLSGKQPSQRGRCPRRASGPESWAPTASLQRPTRREQQQNEGTF